MSNNILGKTALKYAWPRGTKLSKYKYGPGKGYNGYTQLVKKMYPHAKNKKQKVGASCDIFPGTIIRATGVDPKFPMHLKDQQKYFKTDRFKKRFYKVGKGVSVSKLQGGDYQIKKNHHVRIIVEINGKKYVANAHYKKHNGTYAVIDAKASKEKDKFVTYRLRESADPKKEKNKSTTSKKTSTKTKSNTSQVTYYVSKTPSSAEVAKLINPLNAEILKDIKQIKKYYPSYKNSITNSSIFDATGLMKQYKNLLEYLQKKISKTSNLVENHKYIYFYNNNKLSYPHLLTYKIENNKNYSYYDCSSITEDKWVALYKDLYLKYRALEYYNLSIKNYKSIQSYIQNLHSELGADYNIQLSNLYTQIQDFVESHIENFNNQNALKDINNKISALELEYNNIHQNLYMNYNKRMDLQQELAKYQKILDNILQMKNNFKQNNFSDNYAYWHKNIIQEPSLINFWIDFLNSGELYNYQIKNVGRKAFSETKNEVNSLYYREVPQVIYYNNNINKNKTGYIYLKVNDIETLFQNSKQGLSAKNEIDTLLYQYSYCSESLNLLTIPIYYLEPNARILVYNEKTHVNNEYTVVKLTKQLSYNGTLSISAVKVVDKLY